MPLMKAKSASPIMISPIPAVAAAASPRSVSVKRLSRLRLNWFVVGSVFGIGLSFFMNFVLGAVVLPGYEAIVARGKDVAIVEQSHELATVDVPPSVVEAKAETAQKSLEAESPAPTLTYPVTLALKVTKGDTLLDMLIANHVQNGEAHEVVNALRAKFNPGKLKVGQRISVTLDRHEKLGDAAAVKELAIKLPNLSTIELQRGKDGEYNVAASEETASSKTFRGFGKVRTSILQAGLEGQIPMTAMNEVIKAFSYDVDFQREIHPGDTIEVLMDRAPAKSGTGYSNVGSTLRYASLTLRGKKHEIFRSKDAFGELAWFDGKGNSIKKSLLRTPVDAVHITSGFGMRTHPLLGYTKMHKGVDFGAPTGTPIMAAGDGVVEFKGWKGGYGNFVVIRHNNTYETAYGHVSRFGAINVGGRVKQGQVIAYVGSTGNSTGPHLHYEVRQNDTQVNPMNKQFNMASGLSGKALTAFKAAKQSTLNELATLSKSASGEVASR